LIDSRIARPLVRAIDHFNGSLRENEDFLDRTQNGWDATAWSFARE